MGGEGCCCVLTDIGLIARCETYGPQAADHFRNGSVSNPTRTGVGP